METPSMNQEVHDLVKKIGNELCYDFNLRVALIMLKHDDPKLLQEMISFFDKCEKDRTIRKDISE